MVPGASGSRNRESPVAPSPFRFFRFSLAFSSMKTRVISGLRVVPGRDYAMRHDATAPWARTLRDGCGKAHSYVADMRLTRSHPKYKEQEDKQAKGEGMGGAGCVALYARVLSVVYRLLLTL